MAIRHRTSKMLWQYGLFAVLASVLFLLLIVPVWLTVRGAFSDDDGVLTLRYFLDPDLGVLRDPLYREGLLNATWVALATTTLSIAMAVPMALTTTRFKFRGKVVVTGLVLAPLILPPFVGAIGLQAMLGRAGALNALLRDMGFLSPEAGGIDFLGAQLTLAGMTFDGRFWAIVLMEALHLYPIIYLNASAALANVDPSLEEAAQNLGCGPWRRFRKVTLPLILPGVFAGGTIVLIWSFTELGTPLIFEYTRITPVQVFYGIQEVESSKGPYALVVVMLIASAALYLAGKLAFGGRAHAMQGKATAAVAERPLRGFMPWFGMVLTIGISVIAIVPHLGVILSAFAVKGSWYDTVLPQQFTASHFGEVLVHDLAGGSIVNSLIYAFGATIVAAVLGVAVAYLVVRCKVRGAGALDTLAMLPLATPGLVLAFGFVAMSLTWPLPELAAYFQENVGQNNPDSFWFQFGSMFQLRGQAPHPGLFLVAAYAIRRLPYMLRAAVAGLEQTSGDLEEAAHNLGASGAHTLRKIVLPMITANLIAGGVLVFSFAMLEVSDSLILAEKAEHYPITKAIWSLFQRLGDGQALASAMGVWGMALLLTTLLGAAALMGKKLGSVFRA
ncbi:MAG: iron ABC transporter permease [Planctomycetota bacterium]